MTVYERITKIMDALSNGTPKSISDIAREIGVSNEICERDIKILKNDNIFSNIIIEETLKGTTKYHIANNPFCHDENTKLLSVNRLEYELIEFTKTRIKHNSIIYNDEDDRNNKFSSINHYFTTISTADPTPSYKPNIISKIEYAIKNEDEIQIVSTSSNTRMVPHFIKRDINTRQLYVINIDESEDNENPFINTIPIDEIKDIHNLSIMEKLKNAIKNNSKIKLTTTYIQAPVSFSPDSLYNVLDKNFVSMNKVCSLRKIDHIEVLGEDKLLNKVKFKLKDILEVIDPTKNNHVTLTQHKFKDTINAIWSFEYENIDRLYDNEGHLISPVHIKLKIFDETGNIIEKFMYVLSQREKAKLYPVEDTKKQTKYPEYYYEDNILGINAFNRWLLQFGRDAIVLEPKDLAYEIYRKIVTDLQ